MSGTDSIAPDATVETPIELPRWLSPAVGDGEIPTARVLIAGRWREAVGDETFAVRTPIDDTLIARAQSCAAGDVDAAVNAAVGARPEWGARPAAERLELLEEAAELMEGRIEAFARIITINLGKPHEAAMSEADAARERLELVREEVRKIFGEYLPGDWIPDATGKMAVVQREPAGTVAAIGPFNYPLFLSASKIIPALAAGNTVVAKAPSADPLPLLHFARILEEAGLPDGALNVITGSGSELGDPLAGHDGISMVSFTGSSAAGRAVAEAAGVKPLHLEMGGNAPGIVLDDADLDLAADRTVAGAYKSAGQRCDAISRVFVDDDVYDEYVRAVVGRARGWTLGDPRETDTDVGPLVDASAAAEVQRLVTAADEAGAETLLGGDVEAAFHEPTVLADVPRDAEILWEEHFGPVLPIVPVEDRAEAVELANRSRYGLDGAVYTTSHERAWEVSDALQCGMVTLNETPKHGVGHFPFGGRTPASGIGREGLGYSIDECTQLKTVVLPT